MTLSSRGPSRAAITVRTGRSTCLAQSSAPLPLPSLCIGRFPYSTDQVGLPHLAHRDGEVDIRDLPAFFPAGSAEHTDLLRFVRRELAEEEERRVREGRPKSADRRPTTDDRQPSLITLSLRGHDPDIVVRSFSFHLLVGILPARTTCPLRLMIQLAPLDASLTEGELRLAESELRRPTGLPTRVIRVQVAGGVWSSWECGVAGLIEGKGEILRAESFWRGSVDCAFCVTNRRGHGRTLTAKLYRPTFVDQMRSARCSARSASTRRHQCWQTFRLTVTPPFCC
jgi:hypothetical protein